MGTYSIYIRIYIKKLGYLNYLVQTMLLKQKPLFIDFRKGMCAEFGCIPFQKR
jgi:hypothetical protein